MNQRNHPYFRTALFVVVLGLVMIAWPGRSQPAVGGQGFKFTEYYDPPHATQLKALLEGARPQRQPDGKIQVTDAKYRTYRVTGEGEMTVEAPQCVYDPGQRSISSSGPLHLKTADGKFSIEGEGFLWQQTNSTLQVSNRVHTVIHPELMGPQTATATNNVVLEQTHAAAEQAAGIDVFADQFEYAMNSGRGVYQGNVHVAGTNLTSTAGRMTIVLSAAERHLQTLEAEENVIIDYKQMHATGGQALYSADTGMVRLTNQPTWRLEQRDGSGDELVLDQTNGIFQANGHARLRTPAQNMGVSRILSEPGSVSSNAVPTTNHFVEVLCDSYELRTNWAVFRQEVRVSDRVADQLKGEMSCALLTLTFTGTNELQKMLAERQVVISQQDKQFTAEKAEYTGTNGVLDLTGSPGWRAGLREGKGDLVRVHAAREEMLVQGNAVMKLPAAELGQSALSAMGTPKRSQSKATTNEFAEVHCQEYFLRPESALFRGGVRIEHPQMKWACEEITMFSLPELGKTGRMMIAEPTVLFDVLDDQGRSFHGTGEKAVFTHRVMATATNDFVELTGSPAMLTATNLVGQNNIITLDLANHKLRAPGRYKLWGSAPAVATTIERPLKANSPK
jgi:lipopolysaccharide export system protein LptA